MFVTIMFMYVKTKNLQHNYWVIYYKLSWIHLSIIRLSFVSNVLYESENELIFVSSCIKMIFF